jgi:PadR family transcriptional regulator PadR
MIKRNDFIRGSVEMLILHILQGGDCYGYLLTQLIKKHSEGLISVPAGSLYPSLYRLEDKGYISEEKRQVGKRLVRTYYHIEESGKAYLNELVENYEKVNDGICKILDARILP